MKNCIYYVFGFIFYLLIWISLAQDDATAAIHNTILSDSTKNNSSEERNNHNNEINQNFDEQQQSEESVSVINDLEPSSVEVLGSFSENNNINVNNNDNSDNENSNVFNKQVFAEATSQNSGVGNEIINSGPPVVVTLSDVATTELQQRATIPSQNNIENVNDSSQIDFLKGNNNSRSEPNNPSTPTPTDNNNNKLEELKLKENLTEEIPSFSEWAQKQLEEAEKNKNPENATSAHHPSNGRQAKHRWKNYASLDCGAKIVAANPEAVSPSAILSPSRDEYKLNTCNGRIWFIVELCEAIQAKKIDFANFELFSSSPKDFTVSVSDRFPTREWSNVGQFTAKDERDIQSFDLHPFLFGKYIKVEVKSHYGSEHYCPISLFKVYGTSEFEVLQKEDPVHAHRLEDDDDDDDEESLDIDLGGDASKNLFSSATDAVISMVKKAAEVLGNKGNNSNQSISTNIKNEYSQEDGICTSPSHLVVCDNCTESLFWDIYGLLSCNQKQIKSLAEIPRIRKALTNSHICHKFGLDFRKISELNSIANAITSFFSEQFLGAMCNTVAIMENKVVLNTSKEYSNSTESKSDEEIVNIETSEPHVIQQETLREITTTETLNLEQTETITKSTSDSSISSQIKPTKTLSHDSALKESNTEHSHSLSDVRITETETVSNFTEKVEPELQEEKDQELSEVFNTAESSTENLDEHLEHFISEFQNGENSFHPIATTSSTPQAQKESVFLRLSNRIKALERNMSLSGQYLEELSKRYKKQVEEIQKVLDKTILSIAEETQKKDERNRQLEERVAVLTASVEALLAEKNSWSSTVYCIVISTLVTLFVISFCYTKTESSRRESIAEKPIEVKRRKSIDVVQHNRSNLEKKTRRPSDQALKIVRSSMESKEGYISKKKKKKKHVMLKRSNSINTLSEESEYHVFKPVVNSSQIWDRQKSAPAYLPVDWVEGKHLEEVPFVLEDSEHSSLEPLALAAADDDSVKVPVAPPNYLRTALTARSVRINNGDTVVVGDDKKWMSVVEPSRSLVPSNGNVNNATEETPKKEKKSFKKILRKVF